MLSHEEYLTHDALGLAALVREGRVTPTELLEIALARVEALNPRLNAVVRLMEADARAAAAAPAAGPFSGVPFLAKDLMSQYRGHPTSAGSRLLSQHVADHDSELVRRVRASGLLVLGNTNLPEWGLVPFTEPELFGPCRNPWDTDRTPGGSSGGSAAAVAAGIVPMAGGGDGGGSIRIPASCCGLFGLKPTRARTPTGPDYALLWRGAVVEHVLTRSVRDSAAMLDATHGPEAGAPFEITPPGGPYLAEVGRDPVRLRIGFTTRPLLHADVHADCVAAVQDAAALLARLGHQVEEATPEVDGDAFARAFLTMVCAELGADFRDASALLGRRARRGDVEPATWALHLLAEAFTAGEYAAALRELERTGRSVAPFFQEHDLLLTPTLASPPPPIGSLGPTAGETRLLRILGAFGSGRLVRAAGLLEEVAADAFAFIPWTPVFNVTGNPAMSVPLHWNGQGLPVGVHLVGRFGAEDVLFRLAGQLERARPWMQRLPPLARSLSG
ncbi:MAG: amidase [Longimicrobiales bacterium]|nr:amidase [Longimicrobiales bacterium]